MTISANERSAMPQALVRRDSDDMDTFHIYVRRSDKRYMTPLMWHCATLHIDVISDLFGGWFAQNCTAMNEGQTEIVFFEGEFADDVADGAQE